MSNQLPQDPQQIPTENEPKSNLIGSSLSILKAVLYCAPLVVVLVIVMLALLGPSVGNIFSNIVSAL
jgi:hypothetical protein